MCSPDMAPGLVLNGDDRKDVPSRAARYRVFALVGCGIAVQYWIRASISVAVTLAPERYDWRGPWAALSLSAFFVGYMPCQVPWSRLASRISPRSALASSVAISSAATLAVGCSLRSGAAVCAFRVATGFAQAATFPCTYALVNQWAEPAEISRAIGVAKSIGENGGALLGLAGSELILRARLPLGPKLRVGGVQLVFFLPALAGLAWSLLFVALVPAAPAAARDRAASSASAAAAAPVVWRSLLFGRVQLVIYCNHAASAWLSYLLLTELPTFAEEALGLEGAKASLCVATPYVLIGLGLLVGGRACDAAIARGHRRADVRVVCQVVGSVVSATFLFLAALLAPAAPGAAIACLNLGALCYVGVGLGVCAIFLELANADPGLFYAVSNMLATVPGIVVPIAAAALLRRFSTHSGWVAVFGIGLVVVSPAAAAFVYTFYGADIAPRKSIDRASSLADPLLDALDEAPRIASTVLETDDRR